MAKKKGVSDSEPSKPDKKAFVIAASGSTKDRAEKIESAQGEPNEVHLAWYREWTVKHRSIADIARDAGVTRSTAHEAIHKVKEWTKLHLFENIVDYRHQQTATLTEVVREALEAWQKSKEKAVTITTESGVSAGKHGGHWSKDSVREQEQCGGSQYLAEARAALAEIREIWGVNMPKKIAMEITEHEGLIDPSGMSYDDAIVEQAKAIVAAHEAEKCSSGN